MVGTLAAVGGGVLQAEEARGAEQGEEVVCRELPGLLPLVHVGVDARVDEGSHGLAEGVVIIGEAHAATIPTALP